MDQDHEAAERRLERLRLDHAHSMELLRATVAFEHAALRPSFLLNGGALVVFLALFGAIKTARFPVAGFDEAFALQAMATWGFGLIVAAAANIFGYYSQFSFRRAWDNKVEARRQYDRRIKRAKPRIRHALRVYVQDSKKASRQRKAAEVLVVVSAILFIEGFGVALLSISDSFRSYVVPFLCYPLDLYLTCYPHT